MLKVFERVGVHGMIQLLELPSVYVARLTRVAGSIVVYGTSKVDHGLWHVLVLAILDVGHSQPIHGAVS